MKLNIVGGALEMPPVPINRVEDLYTNLKSNLGRSIFGFIFLKTTFVCV